MRTQTCPRRQAPDFRAPINDALRSAFTEWAASLIAIHGPQILDAAARAFVQWLRRPASPDSGGLDFLGAEPPRPAVAPQRPQPLLADLNLLDAELFDTDVAVYPPQSSRRSVLDRLLAESQAPTRSILDVLRDAK